MGDWRCDSHTLQQSHWVELEDCATFQYPVLVVRVFLRVVLCYVRAKGANAHFYSYAYFVTHLETARRKHGYHEQRA